MRDQYKVLPEKLYHRCDPEIFSLPAKEEEAFSPNGIIGQERAVKAVDFGLRINRHGYNLFISGSPGVGKKSYTQAAVTSYAKDLPVPEDWIYVFNFAEPERPRAFKLPAGGGHELCLDMEKLVASLKEEIPKVFGGEEYERQRTEIIKEYQNKRNAYLEDLDKFAESNGFTLKKTATGFMSVPVVEGKQLSQEEYEALEPDLKEKYEKSSQEVQLKALEIMPRLQGLERELKEKVVELEQELALFAIGHIMDSLKSKYRAEKDIVNYLDEVRNDALENLDDFRAEDEDQSPFPWLKRAGREEGYKKYAVNVFVDNRETKGGPVVVENNPTYYNLIGRVEYENKMGMFSTDFSMVKAGALQRANGGYLILQVEDVLRNINSWEALKRVLKTREVRIENLGEHYGLVAMSTLRPAPIPVEVKVILIGNPFYYHILSAYDEDFRKLFKIRADFDYEMDRGPENVKRMANFIDFVSRRDGLKPFAPQAMARVVEYSSELASDQEKLTTRFNDVLEILYEADAWAKIDNNSIQVDGTHVDKAIDEKIYRSRRVEDHIQEQIRRGNLLLKLEGSVVGQVNGLSVMDLGDYAFGRPSRITAATFLGRQGIINIERESRLSGRIHDKGVLILSGFLGANYARETPLALSASITFEQSYGGVEGDSASSAELYAIISSLAGVPLDQGIAVTGSVNQKGEIQPVGGVTQKVEGHFAACRIFGLTGKQGVIIPVQNVTNLMLNREVRQAVAEGLFHIYAISHVNEGLEILTGMKAGELVSEGSFEKDCVHYKVQEKIKEHYRFLKDRKDDPDTDSGTDGEEIPKKD
jgi:lon-related putative ATP-dependent protease